jgi:NIPSNAP
MFPSRAQSQMIAAPKGRAKVKLWKLDRWAALRIGLVAVVAVGLIGARLALASKAKADSDRVFELRIYHAAPGKLTVMESRFRDTTSKILARHHLNVVGYWVTEDAPDNAFVFLFAHESREEAKRNWEAFRVDPEFQEILKAEQAEKTLEKAEVVWMRPTDFSPMK